MAAENTSGAVTLWKSGRRGLYADDHGLTVQRSARRIRTIGWPEMSRLEETGGYDSQSGGYLWGISVVLHTGEKVSAVLGWHGSDAPQIAAAVVQVAERYGIPSSLAGIPMKGGRPARRGLYGDPFRQAGLRYWDGSQWSPLLPEDIARRASVMLRESPDSWSALPTAAGSWTYPSAQARRSARWSAVFATVSATLVAGGFVALQRSGPNRSISDLFWVVAVVPAVWALRALVGRRVFVKLDRAARAAPGSWSTGGINAREAHRPDQPGVQDGQLEPPQADEPVHPDPVSQAGPVVSRGRWLDFAEPVAILCGFASFALGVRHVAVDLNPFKLGYLGVLGMVSASLAMLLNLVIFATDPNRYMSRRGWVRFGLLFLGFVGFLLLIAGDPCQGGCGA